jgi:thioredoxin reductase (NADPH)
MTERGLQAVAFPTLDDSQVAALARCTEISYKRYRDGERLFSAGDRDIRFSVVKSGSIEIVDESGQGDVKEEQG